MRNQVFLSYRHESVEHSRAVLQLGEALRREAIPVALDQFYLDENPGGPDEGWPKWCEDCANESACVLIVASEGWFSAYNKRGEPGGLGSATEADIFRQVIWDEKGNNERIRLAFLHQVPIDKVPVRLRPWHHFKPYAGNAELEQLIRWVGSRLDIQSTKSPPVRWPPPTEFQLDCADREKTEWQGIVELLAGRSSKRILLIEGASGLGKSLLIRHAATYAKELGILVVSFDFKGGGVDLPAILGQFDLDLGMHLPNFSRLGANKTHLLRKDLRALRRPILITFDGYEEAARNEPIADWLCQQFLNEIETAIGLVVIVAGQTIPRSANTSWSQLTRCLLLEPITEPEHWESWINRRYPGFCHKGVHIPTVLMIAQGNPAVVAASCEAIAES